MNPSENLNIKDITEVGIWVRLNRIHMLHEGNQSVADWRMLKGVHAGNKQTNKKKLLKCLSSSSNYLQSLCGDWHIVEQWRETAEDGSEQYGLFEMSKICQLFLLALSTLIVVVCNHSMRHEESYLW